MKAHYRFGETEPEMSGCPCLLQNFVPRVGHDGKLMSAAAAPIVSAALPLGQT